jgi:hypothetical protein
VPSRPASPHEGATTLLDLDGPCEARDDVFDIACSKKAHQDPRHTNDDDPGLIFHWSDAPPEVDTGVNEP